MRTQAQYNETVCGLLFRVFGDDSDSLEAAFYAANPSQKTRFLEPQQWVELPELEVMGISESVSDDDELEVWQ